MALPTNSGLAKNRGCNPVSSNCVVWQGPDLDCIDLCKGDTISEVTAKLAEELCTILELLEIEDLDLSCLNIVGNDPEDIQELLQLIVDRVCALEGIDPGAGGGASPDCPDNCIVNMASCFHYIDGGTGDTVTTSTLTDYVTLIGNRICDILNDITVIQNQITTLEEEVFGDGSGGTVTNEYTGGLVGGLKSLEEEKTSKSELNYVNSTKIDPSGASKFITAAVRSLENSFITTKDAIGDATALYLAAAKEGTIGQEKRLDPAYEGIMSSIPGWINNPQTIGDSIGNAWLAITDLRQAVEYIQDNCCVTSCSDLFFNFQATLTVDPGITYVTLFTAGSRGFEGWSQCGGTTIITITDSLGNTTSSKVDVIALIENPSGQQIELTGTPIDFTKDITIVAETCFENAGLGSTCEKDYEVTLYSSAACPTVSFTIYTTSINYSFTSTSGFTYIANVYLAGAPTPFASQIISAPPTAVINSISGLTADTDYEFELVIVNGANEQTPCPKQPFTTLPNNCTPPINATAVLTI